MSRGSGNVGSNREKEIRRKFVDKDYVEAVILLPENMFYNTTAPGNIIVINKDKKHKGEILLINASKEFVKGRPKNYLTEENIRKIVEVYRDWREVEGFSKIITIEEAARNDYNLSPSRYVSVGEEEEYLPIDEVLVELAQVEEERTKLIETLVEMDDELMERYLEGEEVGEQDLYRCLKKGMKEGQFAPLVCGSSFKVIGIQPLMDLINLAIPSPLEKLSLIHI